MHKPITALWALVVCSVFIAPAGLAQGPKPEPEFIMEVGTVAPSGSPWAQQLKDYRKYVQDKTGGRVKVKLRLGRSNERSLARRTAAGTMQAFGGSTGGLSSIVREMNVFEAPYVFESEAQADSVLDNPKVLAQVRRILQKRQLVFGLWAENGFRSYFTRKPIRAPSDMKGMRLRSQEAIAHVETYKAFGASPVTIDVANTMTSIQTGVVDGFDNTPLFAMATTWYQGLKDDERNLFLSRHAYQPGILVYSKKWFDTLPKDIQAILQTVPQQLVIDGRKGVRSMEPVLLKNLARYGYEIHEPTKAELESFKKGSKGVVERVAAKTGPEAKTLLKEIRAAM